MKKLKIFPKMFIQIFSVLGIIIILVHLLVYFIFPKTYLETRKEKIHNIADEISGNMNGKEMKYIEQTLELYSKSSEIKAFIKEKNNKNEIQIKDDINVNLESDSNSLIIEEREIKLNDGKKINLQFVSTADMQKDAKNLIFKFLPYSLLISISFSAIISLIYAKLIKNNIQEIKIVTDKKNKSMFHIIFSIGGLMNMLTGIKYLMTDRKVSGIISEVVAVILFVVAYVSYLAIGG